MTYDHNPPYYITFFSGLQGFFYTVLYKRNKTGRKYVRTYKGLPQPVRHRRAQATLYATHADKAVQANA